MPESSGQMKAKIAQNLPGHNAEIFKGVRDTIQRAKRSIYIETPYLTSHRILAELKAAAKRGVKVSLIVPGCDYTEEKSAYHALAYQYAELLEAGIQIYEYPGYNHGKVMVTDDRFVALGSSNYDGLSFRHILEINANIDDKATAAKLLQRFIKPDISAAKRIGPEAASHTKTWRSWFFHQFSNYL